MATGFASDSDLSGAESDSAAANSLIPVGYTFEPTRNVAVGLRSLDLAESSDSDGEESSESDPAPDGGDDRTQNTDWCSCSNCQCLPTSEECRCCREMQELVRSKMDDLTCITDHPKFSLLCQDVDVLEVGLMSMKDLQADSLRRPISPRTYRLMAYRHFSLWARGKMGKRVRKVIPSCAVGKIRAAFPEPNGQYHGFEYAD